MRAKHLCNKRTCKGCMTCADPGPKGVCLPCSQNKTDAREAITPKEKK